MTKQLTHPRWQFTPAFETVSREMDQFFDSLVGTVARNRQPWSAGASLWEDENHLHIELELPGVERDKVEITFENRVLTIAAEKIAPGGERKVWHNERSYGKVERKFTLPNTVDGDSIEASLSGGVLHVLLAKKPEVQPKRIEVKGE